MIFKTNVEKFISAVMKYKGDKYSQPKRMVPGYSDCTSLVYKGLKDSGFLTNKEVTVTTHRMGVVGDSRFRQIPKSELQRGDILWGGAHINGKWEGHVAVYLGGGRTIEARVKEGVDYNKNRPYFTRVYRIVALEGKVPATTPTMNILSKGSKGAKVKDIQTKLNQHGAKLKIDGIFGVATDLAVKNFQRANGLLADGIVGSMTLEVLNKPLVDRTKYAKIIVKGKPSKISGYVENGTTYIDVEGKKVPVRKFFETLGMVVTWKDETVHVE